MQYLEIYFKNMEEMVDFVRRANTVEADVDLQFGHILGTQSPSRACWLWAAAATPKPWSTPRTRRIWSG